MWRDWLLVAAVLASTAIEVVARDDVSRGLMPIVAVLLVGASTER